MNEERGDAIVRANALKDSKYCPYCLRCSGLVRMKRVSHMFWRCRCGAMHDERDNLPPLTEVAGSPTWWSDFVAGSNILHLYMGGRFACDQGQRVDDPDAPTAIPDGVCVTCYQKANLEERARIHAGRPW